MSQILPIAAPSCVIPAHVEDNARFLSGRVEEVGICLFEAQSSLDYTVEDLPLTLKDLPLQWHVHLPMDLPWEAGGAAAAALALAVSQQTRFLQPRFAVLHPPAIAKAGGLAHFAGGKSAENDQHSDTARDTTAAECAAAQGQLLRDFARMWQQYCGTPLLLENTEDCALTHLPVGLFDPLGEQRFGVCLDTGHLLAYAQEELLQRQDLLARVGMVHWSATAKGEEGSRAHQHLPLTHFTPEALALFGGMVAHLPQGTRHMLEIFHWAGVEQSWPVLQHLLEA